MRRLLAFAVISAALTGAHLATGLALLPGAVVVAALAIAVIGIPHGAMDIELAAIRFGRATARGRLILTGGYLGGGAAMALLWFMAPAAALAAFLIIAIVHFGQDWHHGGEPFLGIMAGWALIATPALFHRAAVGEIFSWLAGGSSGWIVADLLACTAIPAALASLIFMAEASKRGRLDAALYLAVCLIAAAALPPLIGFALYFCLLHTPRHMADAWAEAAAIGPARRTAVVVAVSALALAPLGLVAGVGPPSPDGGSHLVAASFVLISSLTVPHFAFEAWRHRRAVHQRQPPMGPMIIAAAGH